MSQPCASLIHSLLFLLVRFFPFAWRTGRPTSHPFDCLPACCLCSYLNILSFIIHPVTSLSNRIRDFLHSSLRLRFFRLSHRRCRHGTSASHANQSFQIDRDVRALFCMNWRMLSASLWNTLFAWSWNRLDGCGQDDRMCLSRDGILFNCRGRSADAK